MSEEIAEAKKAEIEALEKQETEDKRNIAGDVCPVCGQRPITFPYICFFPSPYGWVECASCGTVFAPLSIRKQKLAATEKAVLPAVEVVG